MGYFQIAERVDVAQAVLNFAILPPQPLSLNAVLFASAERACLWPCCKHFAFVSSLLVAATQAIEHRNESQNTGKLRVVAASKERDDKMAAHTWCVNAQGSVPTSKGV